MVLGNIKEDDTHADYLVFHCVECDTAARDDFNLMAHEADCNTGAATAFLAAAPSPEPREFTPIVQRMANITIRVAFMPSRGFSATLEYAGKSFIVFGQPAGLTTVTTWPTYIEALRAADDYRANRWHRPSEATLAAMDARANEVTDYGEPWH